MKKIKTKFVTAVVASAIFSVGYSVSASADSVITSNNVETQQNIPPITITPFQNMEFQGGSGGYWTNTSKLTYIQNTASGVLYYDRVNHKYVFAQTRGAMGAAIYVFNAQGVNW